MATLEEWDLASGRSRPWAKRGRRGTWFCFAHPTGFFSSMIFFFFIQIGRGGAGPTGPSSRSVTAGCLLRVAVPWLFFTIGVYFLERPGEGRRGMGRGGEWGGDWTTWIPDSLYFASLSLLSATSWHGMQRGESLGSRLADESHTVLYSMVLKTSKEFSTSSYIHGLALFH